MWECSTFSAQLYEIKTVNIPISLMCKASDGNCYHQSRWEELEGPTGDQDAICIQCLSIQHKDSMTASLNTTLQSLLDSTEEFLHLDTLMTS